MESNGDRKMVVFAHHTTILDAIDKAATKKVFFCNRYLTSYLLDSF